MSPTKMRKTPKQGCSGGSDNEDYHKKRDRNNQAVKRSRIKSKQRVNQTKDRVDNWKASNDNLEERIAQRGKERKTLWDLFLDTAKAKIEAGTNVDSNILLADSDGDDTPGKSDYHLS